MTLPPGIFCDEQQQWSYRDHDGSEYGPFEGPEQAARAYQYSEDERLGRKHTASPQAAALLTEFLQFDTAITELEEQVKDLKARRKYIAEHELIETLTPEERERGVVLPDGSEWTFEQQYHCSVKAEDKDAAIEYLRREKEDSMLRTTITVSFKKDAHTQARAFQQMLASALPEYEVSLRVGKVPDLLLVSVREMLKALGVDPMVAMEAGYELPGATMRAYVIKKLKQGKQLPDAFSVYAPLQPKRVLTIATMPELPDQTS